MAYPRTPTRTGFFPYGAMDCHEELGLPDLSSLDGRMRTRMTLRVFQRAPMLESRSAWCGSALLLAVAVALIAPSAAQGQTARGILVDEHTGEPIALGKVMLVTATRDSIAATLTTDEGYFELQAGLPGTFSVVAEAFGYWSTLIGPFELLAKTDRIVEARISVRPVSLPGLTVETETEYEPRVNHLVRSGFYERMGSGIGEFITPGEVAMSPATYIQQMFYEKKSTRVFQTQTAKPRTYRDYERVEARATTFGPWGDVVLMPALMGGYCQPWIYIDGRREIGDFESLDDLVKKSEVAAVEIYHAPFDIPTDFRDLAFAGCGALMIWTRR